MFIALKSFCGQISMGEGEVRDIDPSLVQDLLKAGYIKPVGKEEKTVKVKKKKTEE